MAPRYLGWRCILTAILTSLVLFMAAGCTSGITGSEEYDDDYLGPRIDDQYFMVPAGARDLVGEITRSVDISVYLYSRSSGEPVPNREVTFEVLDTEDPTAPTLSSRGVFTESTGAATVTAFLGTETGQWSIRVHSNASNSVEFQVEAVPTEVGALDVELINVSPTIMTLSDIDVRVYRDDRFECDYFNPYGFQDDRILVEEYSPFSEETVRFENLSVRNRYVVTAIARGEYGQIAAGGCVSNVLVDKDQTTKVEMLLQLLPLNPTGRYDVVSHWDFTNAIADSGAIGSAIVRVLNVFDNPGVAIYNELISLIGNLVGGLISSTLDTFLSLTNLDSAFQNMINNFIDNNSVLSQVRDAGRDLRDVVSNLQVHSELSIGKLSSNYEFRGQDNWLGLTLYWRWGCTPADGPECGAIELVPDADGTFAQLGVLSSDWTGRVVAFDQLQIDQHAVSLRYGRLIIYVINDVILPAVTNGNANSMSEAFAYWLGCDSLANAIIPNGQICAAGYCLQASTIENFCSTAVSTIFGFADILINSLAFDMGLSLGGTGRLVEETSDGVVDRIAPGQFSGVIQRDGGQSSSPFTSHWEAVRQ